MKTNFKKLCRNTSKFISKNKARILTITGLGLGTATVIVAIKATPDALMDEEDMKLLADQEGRTLTKFDYIKLKAKHYWPTAALAVASAGCIIASDCFDMKDAKVLVGEVIAAQDKVRTLKETVKEELGEKKAKAIEDKAAEKELKKNPLSPYNTEFDVNNSGFLCYDANSGRYFKSTWEILNAAVNSINAKIHDETFAVLNDFYDLVGLAAVSSGNEIGWDQDVTLSPTCHMGNGGVDDPDCVVINFLTDPSLNYLCRGY